MVTAYCSLFTAIAFATRPTFWSQAVEAEVYTLHILIVAAALLVMLYPQIERINADLSIHHSPFTIHHSPFLPFLIGLGLTNHLTTVFLIPPALLTLWWQRQAISLDSPLAGTDGSGGAAAAAVVPLPALALVGGQWRSHGLGAFWGLGGGRTIPGGVAMDGFPE
ncbi:MAG: DUF2723 domain-containing protein [Chloroflexi bacterium]|nr:DUF2723 domain-containing protein [Chloroflexota bacterium]